jgi:hypothetical protein
MAEYVNKNKHYLKNSLSEMKSKKKLPEFLEDKLRDDLIEVVREINIERVK